MNIPHLPNEVTTEKRVTFRSSSFILWQKTYSRRPLCVPNGLRHATGTGNALLTYKSRRIYIELKTMMQ